MIYIANVRIEPQSSLEELWQFTNLNDAREFSRISYRMLYAAIPGDPKIYKIYPGGRVEVKLRRAALAQPTSRRAEEEK